MLLVCLSPGARAADASPLHVPDTSSPRATLQGFIQTTDDIYLRWADLLTKYAKSGELFPTAAQRRVQSETLRRVPNAVHALDLSEVALVERGIVGAERAIQLREILDRIDLPSMQDVPDAAAMANLRPSGGACRTRKLTSRSSSRGRARGEYLVSPETIARLPDFYQRVKNLPYKDVPARRVEEAYRRFSPNSGRTLYDILTGSPLGLSYFIPLRWVLNWPDWSMAKIGGATVWQWIGVGIGTLVAGLLIFFSRRLAKWLSQGNEDAPSRRWHTLPMKWRVMLELVGPDGTVGLVAPANSSVTAADEVPSWDATEAVSIAEDAYIYGYPLVTFDVVRQQQTNVAMPDAEHAPMGQIIKMRNYPAVDNHCCAAPNADTLYTEVWLDVSKEPWVFSIPEMGDRYYMMPMLDGWSEVLAVPSTRNTGGKAQTYAITGPGWSGALPQGVTQVQSPTGMVWILGRIYSTGTPEDYTAVHALAGQILGRSAQRVRQALHAAAGCRRSQHRHEDGGAQAGQRPGHRHVFQPACGTDEDKPADRE